MTPLPHRLSRFDRPPTAAGTAAVCWCSYRTPRLTNLFDAAGVLRAHILERAEATL